MAQSSAPWQTIFDQIANKPDSIVHMMFQTNQMMELMMHTMGIPATLKDIYTTSMLDENPVAAKWLPARNEVCLTT